MHSSGANRRKQTEASPPTPQSNGDKSICESIFLSARVSRCSSTSSSSNLSSLLSSSHEVTGRSWYRHHPPCCPRRTRGMPPTRMGCQRNAASPQARAWPRSEEILRLYHPRRPRRIRRRLRAAISAIAPPPQHSPPGDYCVAHFLFHR